MNTVAQTLLGCNISERPSFWGFNKGEPFEVVALSEISTLDGSFTIGEPRVFEDTPYIYIGHMSSNPQFRGKGTGQGRRLVKESLEYALGRSSAVTCYILNPIAMALIDEESQRLGLAAYIHSQDFSRPIPVSDVRSSNEQFGVKRLDVLREGKSTFIQDVGLRFPSMIGFQTVVAAE